jgi:octaprenyl-diphosphate synthase
VFDLIQDDLVRFEERMQDQLHSSVAFIEAIGDDLIGAGGKRLRPSLSFLAGRLLDAERESTLQVALAVELLHSASLLHDDLIDDAQTRRGAQAAFRRYGNVVSVMSGDFMLARVLGLLAETGSVEFTRLMSRTAAAICEGEVLQFQTATLEDYSFDTYDAVIEGKTAILLASALEGVAILSGAEQARRDALVRYGMHYGRAFQMQDDYLDLLGDAERLGKPVGGDLREGKATYPVLLLLLEHQVREAGDIVRRHASRGDDVARMIELVREHHADERTRERIRREAAHAVDALQIFDPSPAREALVALAEREIARAR